MAGFVAGFGTSSTLNRHHVNCFKIIRFCLSFLEKIFRAEESCLSLSAFSYKTGFENCRKAAYWSVT